MQAGGAVRSADALIRFSIHPHSAHSSSVSMRKRQWEQVNPVSAAMMR